MHVPMFVAIGMLDGAKAELERNLLLGIAVQVESKDIESLVPEAIRRRD